MYHGDFSVANAMQSKFENEYSALVRRNWKIEHVEVVRDRLRDRVGHREDPDDFIAGGAVSVSASNVIPAAIHVAGCFPNRFLTRPLHVLIASSCRLTQRRRHRLLLSGNLTSERSK